MKVYVIYSVDGEYKPFQEELSEVGDHKEIFYSYEDCLKGCERHEKLYGKYQPRKTAVRYRIMTGSRVKYAGTDQSSWMTLKKARELVNYEAGEGIYEYDRKGDPMHEVF